MNKSERNQTLGQGRTKVSFGEPAFGCPDDGDVLSPARIRRFSQYVLSMEAWFRTADELIEAMNLLEPHVVRFWDDVRSIAFAADMTSDMPAKSQQKDFLSNNQNGPAPSKHNLINQHMMLAGFAIENLCKGYLVGRLSVKERERIQKEGILPKSLKDHDSLSLVEQTGLTLSTTEKDLLTRIADTIHWRGRYPSPTSHKRIRPFFQMGADVRHIKTLLQTLHRHVRANH
jgi:hypothetical protein